MSSYFIVDDEMINIAIVSKLMAKHYPSHKRVGSATSLDGLPQKLNEVKPDILFLDVNIGEREIFEVLDEMAIEPQIIFISSDPKYAIEAFKYNAAHFLLKPISTENFIKAVERSLSRIELEERMHSHTKVHDLSDRFLVVTSMDKHEILKINDIVFCKAEGKCTLFSLINGRNIYSYKNLREYEYLTEKHTSFIRINRTYIINFEFVSRVVKKVGMYCEFINGILIPVSRRKLDDFNRFLRYIE